MESITIKDVAKICGVGVSTVSRAINNHPDINDKTKELILETIKKYNYIPNDSARNLKRVDAKAIAILVKGITNPFFSKMIKIMEKEIQNKKYSLILHHVEDETDEVEVALQLIKEKRLRGIIFLGGYFSHTEEKLRQIHVPFVLSTISATNQIPRDIYSSVCVDDFEESYKMTKYLCDLGHTKIMHITAHIGDQSIGHLRLNGYLKALEDCGIEIDHELIVHMEADFEAYSMKNGYEITKKFLQKGKEFTAVFAISDQLAIGATRAILDAGYQVPADISVAGFDGIDLGRYYCPRITSLKQPVDQIARESIQTLFEAIENKNIHEHKIFKGELVEGESTRSL
jgi:LacI family transcriptional regulator